MVTTYTASANRAFSNLAFGDFVRDLQSRGNVDSDSALPVANEEASPPTYEMQTSLDEKTATKETAPTDGGKTQFMKLRQRLAAKGFSEEDIAARLEKRQARKNAVPTFPKLRKRLAEKGCSEEEIEARISKRQARKSGTNDFPKLRQRMTEKGISEEQIAARIERCRARRAAAREGKVASKEPTQAADDANDQKPSVSGCRWGKKSNCAHHTCGAKRLRPAVSANSVQEPDTTADGMNPGATDTPRGHAFVPYRHLSEITRGGYPKFAGRFNNKEGANPSNVNIGQIPLLDNKTHRSHLDKRMRHLSLGTDYGNSAREMAVKNRAMKKTNERYAKRMLRRDADVFYIDGAYIIHVDLPGAKPEDVAVTWVAEKSAVRVAGIIRREDPQSLGGNNCVLVHADRNTGPFDHEVKLGRNKENVKVNENGLVAILADGVLNIELPKYDGADDSDEFIQVNEKV